MTDETTTAPPRPEGWMLCPRRVEGPFLQPEFDVWRPDGTCSWCGSLSPDALFTAIEAGEELGPTDKSYKVYVGHVRKFYFPHLSKEEQDRFIDLYNARKIRLGYPGHFYVLPFFAVRAG